MESYSLVEESRRVYCCGAGGDAAPHPGGPRRACQGEDGHGQDARLPDPDGGDTAAREASQARRHPRAGGVAHARARLPDCPRGRAPRHLPQDEGRLHGGRGQHQQGAPRDIRGARRGGPRRRNVSANTGEGFAVGFGRFAGDDTTSFCGSSCANNGKGALDTPETLPACCWVIRTPVLAICITTYR
eukprot:5112880-Pyramimonas_sp.AAC.2